MLSEYKCDTLTLLKINFNNFKDFHIAFYFYIIAELQTVYCK